MSVFFVCVSLGDYFVPTIILKKKKLYLHMICKKMFVARLPIKCQISSKTETNHRVKNNNAGKNDLFLKCARVY